MKKRLFISIPVRKDLKQALTNFSESIDIEGANLVPEKNYHVTLKFLGSIEEELIPEIDEKLKLLSKGTNPFFLNILGLTAPKPRFRHSYLLWLQLNSSYKFQELLTIINEELLKFVAPQSESQIPHITLARFKHHFDLADNITFGGVKNFEVNSFELLESTPGENAPNYNTLHRYELSG